MKKNKILYFVIVLSMIILFYPDNHTLKTAIGSESSGFIVGPQQTAKKGLLFILKELGFRQWQLQEVVLTNGEDFI